MRGFDVADAEIAQIVHGEVVVVDVVRLRDVEEELHLLGSVERLDRRLHRGLLLHVRPYADAERSASQRSFILTLSISLRASSRTAGGSGCVGGRKKTYVAVAIIVMSTWSG